MRFPLLGLANSIVDEAKKVIWPTRELLIKHTLLVIGSVAVAMLIFAGLDFGLQKLVLYALSR